MSSGLRKSNNALNYVLNSELIWMTGHGSKEGMKRASVCKEAVFRPAAWQSVLGSTEPRAPLSLKR